MTDHDYRTHRAYSNSDLSELFNFRMGNQSKPIDPKAAQFGTTFHQMILEPHKPVDWTRHHVTERVKLEAMEKAYREAMSELADLPFLAYFLPVEVERAVMWTCPDTGLPCKGRLDAVVESSHVADVIVDLKSTSARSASEFFDCFTRYGYDRQAAFYSDGWARCRETMYLTLPAPRFLFVGVQKCKPYNIYTVDMGQSEERRRMLDNARLKNARLLRDAYAESLKADGWRPGSWSRKEGEGV